MADAVIRVEHWSVTLATHEISFVNGEPVIPQRAQDVSLLVFPEARFCAWLDPTPRLYLSSPLGTYP